MMVKHTYKTISAEMHRWLILNPSIINKNSEIQNENQLIQTSSHLHLDNQNLNSKFDFSLEDIILLHKVTFKNYFYAGLTIEHQFIKYGNDYISFWKRKKYELDAIKSCIDGANDDLFGIYNLTIQRKILFLILGIYWIVILFRYKIFFDYNYELMLMVIEIFCNKIGFNSDSILENISYKWIRKLRRIKVKDSERTLKKVINVFNELWK